jgi:hypothetical protein
MSFSKNFDSDFVFYGQINLPWDQVAQDLETVATDATRTHAIVQGNEYQAELAKLTSEYTRYGYTEHNTKIWKTTNSDTKLTFDWENAILEQLPLDHAVATLTRQDPGQILPWHQDRFFFLKNQYPEDPRPIWRFLMFMEDWKMGHVLQVGDTFLHHWHQGDVYVWQPGMHHVSANIGLETKWTCNITGFLTI